MDLAKVEPQKISKDINSYTTFIYGNPKAGKSTFMHGLYGSDAIFARTEKGTKLIAGLFGQDIASWSDFMMFIQQLKRPEVKEKFKVVVIDTLDNLYKFLEKFVKNKYSVDNIKDANGGYGAGYREISEHLFNAMTEIEKEGYTVAFVSHATIKNEKLPDGTEVEKYIPSADKRAIEIASKMVDNLLFAYLQKTDNGEQRALYTRETLYFQAGSRFKYIPSVLPLDAERYKQEVKASLAKEEPSSLKDERESNSLESEDLSFETLRNEAKQLGVVLAKAGLGDKIKPIVEKHLGEGQLLNNATPKQVEQVKLIIEDLKKIEVPEKTE